MILQNREIKNDKGSRGCYEYYYFEWATIHADFRAELLFFNFRQILLYLIENRF